MGCERLVFVMFILFCAEKVHAMEKENEIQSANEVKVSMDIFTECCPINC